MSHPELQQFLKEYLAHLKLEKNLSENTVSSYESDISKFLEYLIQKNISDLNKVKTNTISKYFELLRKMEISSSTTARCRRGVIRSSMAARRSGSDGMAGSKIAVFRTPP